MKKRCLFAPCIFLCCFLYSQVYSQEYSIEQYLNIRGAGSPEYSYNDSLIYFKQSVTGTQQLWVLSKPGGWPEQVTFFQDRINDYEVNPKMNLIAFEKDEGGSEYSSIYLYNVKTGRTEKITSDKPKVLYGLGRWFDDGKQLTYYSNERSPYFYDIYVYNIESGSAKMIYSSDNSNYPSVISSDGKFMVFTRSYASNDNDLYLLNIATSKAVLMTNHYNMDMPAESYAVSFSADGKKVYMITDIENDFYRMAYYSIDDEEIEYPEYNFLEKYEDRDLNTALVSHDKTKLALVVNDEGYDRLFLYDLRREKEIKIPDKLNSASITALKFSNMNDKMIIGVNSAANPSVLYEWTFSSGNIIQLTYPTLAGINPTSFIEPSLVHYKSFDKLNIPAFFYLPKNQGNKKLPCIISIHGGPEGQSTYGFEPVFQYFLNSGYAVVEPNVRGSTGYGKKYAALDNVRNRQNSVKDIEYLVKYLKTRNDIDTSKIIVYGGSYGGYMVLACLTLYPDLFAAGIDVVGISSFITFLQNTADYRRSNRESEYGSLTKDYEFLDSISPIKKVDKINAPLMIIHGRNDPRVPVGEAQQIYDAIKNRGGTAELLIYEDEGHGLAKLKNRLDAYPKIVEFLNRHVINK